MRAFPTRRDFILILVIVTCSALFLQFGLGSFETLKYSGLDWSRGVTASWRGEQKSQPLAVVPKISLDAAKSVKESTFTWHDGKVPTTEIRVHVPGVSFRCQKMK